jgi:hypothetical protein
MRSYIFRDVTPYSLVEMYEYFVGMHVLISCILYPKNKMGLRFYGVTTVPMRSYIFRDVTPYSLVEMYEYFVGMHVLSLLSLLYLNLLSSGYGFQRRRAKSCDFLDIPPFSLLKISWRFGGTRRLHCHG